MNKTNLLTALLLCGTCTLFAQTVPSFGWVKPVYGATQATALQAAFTDLETDASGNTYLTGEFIGQLNFGSGVSLTGNASDPTLFLVKYGADGTPLWAKKGAPATPAAPFTFNRSCKIATDAAGNVYWSGDFITNSVDFGNNVIVTRSCTNDCSEGFLLKFDGAGSLVFQKNIRAKLGEQLHLAGVAADAQGRHYLTGSYTGNELWLQGGANIGGLTTQGFFLAAYNASGNAEWIAFTTDESIVPSTQSIKVSPDGNRIVIAGNHGAGTLNFSNGAIVNSTASKNRFVLWYSVMGAPMGVNSVNSDQFVEIFDVAVDSSYTAFATCDFSGTLKDKQGTTLYSSSTERTAAMLLMTPDGVAAAGNIIPHTLSALPTNTIAIAPSTTIFLGGLSGEPLTVPGFGTLGNSGCLDAVIQGNGNSLPVAVFGNLGGSGCERIDNIYFGSMMAPDAEGNLMVAGVFENGGSFGTDNFNGNGLWVAKMYTGLVATSEPGESSGIAIQPNPSSGLVQISFPENASGQCRIFSTTGQLMSEADVQSSISVQVENWPSGLYLVEFLNKQGKMVREKLLVQH